MSALGGKLSWRRHGLSPSPRGLPSRKSAYALKGRDPAFASAWDTAVNAAGRGNAPSSWKGDKVEKVEDPPIPSSHGDTSPSRSDRERAFAGLLATLRQSAPLADPPPAQ